jgi:putative oxidoreductase
MFNLRTVARTLLAGIFVVGGWDSFQNPKAKVDPAREAGTPITERLGIQADAVDLVQVTGATQVVGGVMLAMGWMPRLAALTLGATLVPTTIGAHRFWEAHDPDRRKAQLVQALKNASILGGLIMAILDHGGRPSVFWMTRRAAQKAGQTVSDAVSGIGD